MKADAKVRQALKLRDELIYLEARTELVGARLASKIRAFTPNQLLAYAERTTDAGVTNGEAVHTEPDQPSN